MVNRDDGNGNLLSKSEQATAEVTGAHRLIDIADNARNTIHATLDAMGNQIQEDAKVQPACWRARPYGCVAP